MTSDACTSSLPNMEGVTNNTLPNSFELKDNSISQHNLGGPIWSFNKKENLHFDNEWDIHMRS